LRFPEVNSQAEQLLKKI